MATKRRKNIRLPRGVYEHPNQIFSVTICTTKRRRLFADPIVAREVVNSLKSGPVAQKSEMYAYCLMPDHLHALISQREGNLIEIVGGWKKYTGNLLRKDGLKGPFWQRSFYDHALRKEEDLIKTAQYMVMNPVRARLVAKWRQYPFSWHRWM
ncbi:MAG: transposase [Deltaproteobacteria bacterium]|nr:transposase [Deltaproteobacteria bacterium]